MIKEVIVKDIASEDMRKQAFLDIDGGKILKIYVEFAHVIGEAQLKILTKEGEEIIYATNNDDDKVFYPRCNITQGIMAVDPLVTERTQQDYYYFVGGLLLDIRKDNKQEMGVLIKELRIIYDGQEDVEGRNSGPISE